MSDELETGELLKQGEKAEPLCPYCGRPVQFRTGIVRTAEGQVVFFAFCAYRDCRKLLPMAMIGQERPLVSVPPGLVGRPA